MKHIAFLFSMAIVMLGINPALQAQSDGHRNGAAGYVNVHVPKLDASRISATLKDLSAVNINSATIWWIGWKKAAIDSFALILQDTMVRNAYDAMDAETDIWIRLEGTGEERVFCAGSKCAE